jgi:protein involved in sex pheromone biosynthesis
MKIKMMILAAMFAAVVFTGCNTTKGDDEKKATEGEAEKTEAKE